MAIQDRRFGPSSLDRFASARDDGGRSTETPKALEQAAPDNPPPVVYDPTVGPSLSPMQSALQAALWRLVARDDHRNPLGSGGDWRAARGAIAAFYASRAYAPVWVSETGLTEAGRAALTQLKRASDDGLNLSAFALPRDLGSDLDPEAIAEAETTIASAVVAYAEQATGSRVPPVACLAAHLRDAEHRRSGRSSGRNGRRGGSSPAACRLQPAAEGLPRAA